MLFRWVDTLSSSNMGKRERHLCLDGLSWKEHSLDSTMAGSRGADEEELEHLQRLRSSITAQFLIQSNQGAFQADQCLQGKLM